MLQLAGRALHLQMSELYCSFFYVACSYCVQVPAHHTVQPDPLTFLSTHEGTRDAQEPSAYSQMLVVEVEQYLVPTLVLLLDLLVLEIATSGHPAMNLVTEGFDVVVYAQGLAELFHCVLIFVAGCEHAEGYFDAFGVRGIDHSGVDFGDSGEGGAGLGGQGDDLCHEISDPSSKCWGSKK